LSRSQVALFHLAYIASWARKKKLNIGAWNNSTFKSKMHYYLSAFWVQRVYVSYKHWINFIYLIVAIFF
jgi:hypothetical protein